MTADSTTVTDTLPAHWASVADLNTRLRSITERVLRDYPGVEGGFFLGGDQNRFAGVAYPTGPAGPQGSPQRNDPPPLEMPYIRAQVMQSLQEREVVTNLRTVEKSLVVILTEHVPTVG